MIFGGSNGGLGPTVTFFGHPEDEGWNANIAAGLERAAREFNFDLRTVVPTVGPGLEFAQVAAEGADLIIGDDVPTLVTPTVFADFPDVQFGIIDGFADSPNTAVVLFANEQGPFLVGVAAALKSETGVIGFVGALRFDVLELFRAGYEAGARYIDPDIEILATYIQEPFADAEGMFLNPFARPDLGNQRATALYESGADVVFQAAGFSGFGAFNAAVEQSDRLGRHLWAIGVDNDQWFQVDTQQQDHLLTSMIKRGDIAAYLLVEQLINGDFAGGVQKLTLVDDAFDFSTQGDGLTNAMINQIEQIKTDIAEGRIDVPTEPLGRLMVVPDPLPETYNAAFANRSPEQILDYFGWLVENRTETNRACFSGTVNQCGQFMMNHLDE